jgi:NAD(P)H-dependent FMN reductase
MSTSSPRIGIVIGTTRAARFADGPTQWLLQLADRRSDASFELVDLRDYPMPFFEEARSPAFIKPENAVVQRWSARMAALDAYIFVTAEYNHSISGVLKNALDYLYPEVNRKPATFLAYGSSGGARAVEHLRHILAEMQVASIKHTVHVGMIEMLGMLREGKTMGDYPYLVEPANKMLDEIIWWAKTLRAGREAGAGAAEAA